ncbi:hypothetical protein L218DRAFT_929768 [Marasmius fiardii PR-910]|nr:hypothetical protein L218DRAFT_929768 [Marasmius fiardii PR-910]
MGNTASQQNPNQNALKRFSSPRHHHPRHQSVSRGSQPASSPTIFDPTSSSRGKDFSEARDSKDSRREAAKEKEGKHHVHRSLRAKKKSLELPDLAPLSLNPYQPTNPTNNRPSPILFPKTHPISIPGQQEPSPRHRSVNVVDFYQPPQPQSAQPTYRDPISVQKTSHQQSVQPTVPHPSPASFLQPSITPTSGLPTPYASTASSRESSRSPGRDYTPISTPAQSSFHDHVGDITITDEPDSVAESSQFNPLIVHSSIPLGIFKAEGDAVSPLSLPPVPATVDLISSTQSGPYVDVDKGRENSDGGDPEEIMVKVSWHGGGNEVFLARQGDEKYMNKMKMERDGSTNTFTTSLYLAPGTHHIRFFVDEQWRVADDLPATVDDLGGLANYVAVGPGFADKTSPSSPVPNSPPASTATSVILPKPGPAQKVGAQTPPKKVITTGYSFWDQPDDDDDELQTTPSIPTPPPSYIRTQVAGSSPVGVTRYTTISAYVPKWTSEIPLELMEAAAQEEAFLAHQQAQQAHYYNHGGRGYPRTQHGFMPLPNIPPAPRLPRILEKLILNQQQVVRNTVTASAAQPLAGASLASPGGVTNRIGGIPTQNRERESRDRMRSPIRERERERERTGGPDRRRERDKRSLGMTTTTPIEEKEVELGGNRDKEDRLLPIVTASGTDVSSKEKPSSPSSRDREGTGRHPSVVDNRTIADDSSVLPVPSHVVIHHLCTSAIKNGVLGVGATTRYRKKYMTSIYYKPT